MTDSAPAKPRGPARSPAVWIRPGHAGYIGPELRVDLHSTSVAVLSVGLDGPFVLETATHGEILTRSAYAPARAVHRVNTLDKPILLLWSHASAIEGQMATTEGPYGFDHLRERELVEQCRLPDTDPGRIVALAGAGPPAEIDPRIERVAAAIRQHPDRAFRAEPIAANLGLSHFSETFHRMFGMSATAALRSGFRFDLETTPAP